jgi:2-(1,2-epoxy-1,2-dihydrophenyl)acetyl-CoA isomerase
MNGDGTGGTGGTGAAGSAGGAGASDVQVDRRGPVRVLTVSRPRSRNAFTLATAGQLRRELELAAADSGTGAVVLTGAGGHFSAGGDAGVILDAADGADDAPAKLMRTFHQLVETVWTSTLPVVAAVSGVAYGGAFNLALACDLIVCSADARFCQVFLRRGVVPDLGGAYLLPRLIGMQRAKELMLLTPEIGAARARELGLVNAILPDPQAALEHAVELAARLADGPRFAIAQTKKLLNASTGGTLGSSLQLEETIQAGLMRSEGVKRGFAQFLSTRRGTGGGDGLH